MSEKSVLNETLVAVSALPEALVWRNNTGQAWQGERVHARTGSSVTVLPGMTILRNARPISFGLSGSSDIIGAIQGRPVAIETKTQRGRQSDDQQIFETCWKRAGGLYVLARSREQALEGLLLDL